jgi:hypothetical protein
MRRHCADLHVATCFPESTSAWVIVHQPQKRSHRAVRDSHSRWYNYRVRSILHDREGIKEQRGCACHGAAPPFSHIPIVTDPSLSESACSPFVNTRTWRSDSFDKRSTPSFRKCAVHYPRAVMMRVEARMDSRLCNAGRSSSNSISASRRWSPKARAPWPPTATGH